VLNGLLKRVARGEQEAMRACIDQYGGLLWSLARRLFASTADAEDAVQDAFVSLWQNAERYDEEKGSEVVFVSMIARRRMIDARRKSSRRQRSMQEIKLLKQPEVALTHSDLLERDESVHRVVAALHTLSSEQQKAITFAIHYGLTHEQIANLLGMPLGTVKTHIRRGLLKLREIMTSNDAWPTKKERVTQ